MKTNRFTKGSEVNFKLAGLEGHGTVIAIFKNDFGTELLAVTTNHPEASHWLPTKLEAAHPNFTGVIIEAEYCTAE